MSFRNRGRGGRVPGMLHTGAFRSGFNDNDSSFRELKSLTSGLNVRREQEQAFDASSGFQRIEDGPTRTGYLVNMLPCTMTGPDRLEHAAVDLYFLSQDGSTFKGTVVYQPYLYLILHSEMFERELISHLERKFEGLLASAAVKELEDLELPNHLGGLKRRVVKLSFLSTNEHNKVRQTLRGVVEKNAIALSKGENLDELASSTGDVLSVISDMREYDVIYYSRVSIDKNLRVGSWYEVTPIPPRDEMSMKGCCECKRLPESFEGVPSPRILAWDIECTKAPLKFPDAKIDQIYMISYMVDGEGYLICNREVVSEDIEDFEYSPSEEYRGPFTVMNCANERETILEFVNHCKEVRPQVYVTYNGDFFDYPFLDVRCQEHGIDLARELGLSKQQVGMGDPEWRGRTAVHMDCLYWVKRDSYLPQGSQGLKNVTKAKLGYDPVEVDPEEMLLLARDNPTHMASYSVSDAVATYYLYMKYVHAFIFSLCTIIPLGPEDVLRKGSGTLCEMLLMVEAYQKGILCPNKQVDAHMRTYNGHLLETETYIGGHVECLQSGIFRHDLPIDWNLTPSAFDTLIADIDKSLRFAIEVEGNESVEHVQNYAAVRDDIVGRLKALRDTPVRSEKPVIYHLDVGAMYPNIILTNRLQPNSMISEDACRQCDFGADAAENRCQRRLQWRWRGEFSPADGEELAQVRQQLSFETIDGTPYLDLPVAQQETLLRERLRKYSQLVHKRVKDTVETTKEALICQRENPFYVETVRAFRDRRYEYKVLTKKWSRDLGAAERSGDKLAVEHAKSKVVLFDSLQLAHKCILNSFYGYVMRRGARWHSIEMAGVVTFTGSNLIQQARTLVDQVGKNLELDTDGIWCVLPQSFPQKFTLQLAGGKKMDLVYPAVMLNADVHSRYTNDQYQILADPVSRRYTTRSECSIFFELDGPYSAMVLPASQEEGRLLKKRYVVFDMHGELSELKGFELKRRGELKMIKNFQEQVFAHFLDGDTLQGCYAAVASIANWWLDVLDTRGRDLSDEEIIEYLSENRSMSRALEEYGQQKSLAISTAHRLGEFLGEASVKERGLNCRLVVSKYPLGAPVTERAIPTVIFSAAPEERARLIRKWSNEPSLKEQDLEIRSLLDWSYYRTRLSGAIQKIITIPAALQNIPNPCPRVPHPDWLLKSVAERNDRFQQTSMSKFFKKEPKAVEMGGKEVDIEDSFALSSPSKFNGKKLAKVHMNSWLASSSKLMGRPENEKEMELEMEKKEKEKEKEEPLPPVPELSSIPSPEELRAWVAVKRLHWLRWHQQRQSRAAAAQCTMESAFTLPRLASGLSQPLALLRTPHPSSAAMNSSVGARGYLQILSAQQDPYSPGIFHLWAFTSARTLQRLRLRLDREVLVLRRKPYEPSHPLFHRAVPAPAHILPPSARVSMGGLQENESRLLYSLKVKEAVFQRKKRYILRGFDDPLVDCVFEARAPLVFSLLKGLGCVAELSESAVRRLSVSLAVAAQRTEIHHLDTLNDAAMSPGPTNRARKYLTAQEMESVLSRNRSRASIFTDSNSAVEKVTGMAGHSEDDGLGLITLNQMQARAVAALLGVPHTQLASQSQQFAEISLSADDLSLVPAQSVPFLQACPENILEPQLFPFQPEEEAQQDEQANENKEDSAAAVTVEALRGIEGLFRSAVQSPVGSALFRRAYVHCTAQSAVRQVALVFVIEETNAMVAAAHARAHALLHRREHGVPAHLPLSATVSSGILAAAQLAVPGFHVRVHVRAHAFVCVPAASAATESVPRAHLLRKLKDVGLALGAAHNVFSEAEVHNVSTPKEMWTAVSSLLVDLTPSSSPRNPPLVVLANTPHSEASLAGFMPSVASAAPIIALTPDLQSVAKAPLNPGASPSAAAVEIGLLPILGWAEAGVSRAVQAFYSSLSLFQQHIDVAKYAQIPPGNLADLDVGFGSRQALSLVPEAVTGYNGLFQLPPSDSSSASLSRRTIGELLPQLRRCDIMASMADLFFARMLSYRKQVLWASRGPVPDSGGASLLPVTSPLYFGGTSGFQATLGAIHSTQVNAIATKTASQVSKPLTSSKEHPLESTFRADTMNLPLDVEYPGLHRVVCFELDVLNFTVNALLVAGKLAMYDHGENVLDDDQFDIEADMKGSSAGSGISGTVAQQGSTSTVLRALKDQAASLLGDASHGNSLAAGVLGRLERWLADPHSLLHDPQLHAAFRSLCGRVFVQLMKLLKAQGLQVIRADMNKVLVSTGRTGVLQASQTLRVALNRLVEHPLLMYVTFRPAKLFSGVLLLDKDNWLMLQLPQEHLAFIHESESASLGAGAAGGAAAGSSGGDPMTILERELVDSVCQSTIASLEARGAVLSRRDWRDLREQFIAAADDSVPVSSYSLTRSMGQQGRMFFESLALAFLRAPLRQRLRRRFQVLQTRFQELVQPLLERAVTGGAGPLAALVTLGWETPDALRLWELRDLNHSVSTVHSPAKGSPPRDAEEPLSPLKTLTPDGKTPRSHGKRSTPVALLAREQTISSDALDTQEFEGEEGQNDDEEEQEPQLDRAAVINLVRTLEKQHQKLEDVADTEFLLNYVEVTLLEKLSSAIDALNVLKPVILRNSALLAQHGRPLPPLSRLLGLGTAVTPEEVVSEVNVPVRAEEELVYFDSSQRAAEAALAHRESGESRCKAHRHLILPPDAAAAAEAPPDHSNPLELLVRAPRPPATELVSAVLAVLSTDSAAAPAVENIRVALSRLVHARDADVRARNPRLRLLVDDIVCACGAVVTLDVAASAIRTVSLLERPAHVRALIQSRARERRARRSAKAQERRQRLLDRRTRFIERRRRRQKREDEQFANSGTEALAIEEEADEDLDLDLEMGEFDDDVASVDLLNEVREMREMDLVDSDDSCNSVDSEDEEGVPPRLQEVTFHWECPHCAGVFGSGEVEAALMSALQRTSMQYLDQASRCSACKLGRVKTFGKYCECNALFVPVMGSDAFAGLLSVYRRIGVAFNFTDLLEIIHFYE